MDENVVINRHSLVSALEGMAMLADFGQARHEIVANLYALAKRVSEMEGVEAA